MLVFNCLESVRETTNLEKETVFLENYSPALSMTSNISQKAVSEHDSTRDFTSPESCLVKQASRERSSFLLPATPERLSHHSSAVRAMDRHSGNMKRVKDVEILNTFSKRPSFCKKQSPDTQVISLLDQSSTLPRAHHQVLRDVSTTNHQNDFNNKHHSVDSIEIQDIADISNSKKACNNVCKKNIVQKCVEENIDLDLFRVNCHESSDDAVINPYEEVSFVPSAKIPATDDVETHSEFDDQNKAKHKIQEIMDSVKLLKSAYRPKLPVPRYPVSYDNINFDSNDWQSSLDLSTKPSNLHQALQNNQKTLSSTFQVLSPKKMNLKSSEFSNGPLKPSNSGLTGSSTSVELANKNEVTPPSSMENVNEVLIKLPTVDDRNEKSFVSSASESHSFGSQLRYLLVGGQDDKHVSPINKKKSLLKRSKSPGEKRNVKPIPKEDCKNRDAISIKSCKKNAKAIKR